MRYLLLISLFCETYPPKPTSEHLQLRKTSYRIINNEPTVQLTFTDNIWYQDSTGITQLSGLKSMNDGAKDTIFSVPLGYRFVDLRRKWVYEYRNLSDTAEIIEKHGNADQAQLSGGWNFFRTSAIKFSNLKFIRDTDMNGKALRKYRFVQDFQGIQLIGEAFGDCDRKGTLFLLDVGLSKDMGCPMVKGNAFTQDGKFISSSVEIEFISNDIPDSVKHAFVAWKRNVQKFPVE